MIYANLPTTPSPMRSRLRPYLPHVRVALVVVLVLLAVPVVADFLTAPASVEAATAPNASAAAEGSVTVVTIDALGPAQVVAYGPDGDVLFRNDSYGIYHDVDPSPAGAASVEYVASVDFVDADRCRGEGKCMRNVVERVNLSTGNVTRLYTRTNPNTGSSGIHDVDRINDSVLLIGDIAFPDGVYMVNTTTDEVIWRWNVSEAFEPSSGGQYPGDWTHLNDVEYLPDGRVMVNLRNQDQVVFVEPGEGMNDSWTLGEDGDHGVLYEAHNPDYIPASRGGPAVLVADSENNRIVEYQRVDGAWERSWTWVDPELEWPRDADRLPNGNTLVVDSHGHRIVEVNRTGGIVDIHQFPNGGYDAERLGTGEESAGGRSMAAMRGELGTTDRGQPQGWGVVARLEGALTALFPPLVLHGVLYVLPNWVTPLSGATLLLSGVLVVLWAVFELAMEPARIPGLPR